MELPEDFGFTSDHELLRTTARRLLADRCPISEVRRWLDDPVGFDRALFDELCQHGWAGLLVPETHGGAGLDYVSMAVVLEESGRCLLPSPLFATVLAGVAVDLGGAGEQRARLLPGLAAGERIGTVGLTEPGGSWEADAVRATAREVAGGYELGGVKNHVQWASSADVMIAPFRLEGGEISVFSVDLGGPGVRVEAEVSVDATRRMGRVILDGARVESGARLAGGTSELWRDVLVRGYALMAAEMIGAADQMLCRTRDYANERVQFGRPIGAFQAVKHPLVNVLMAVENARSLVIAAASALDVQADRREALARMAKAAATEALGFAVDRGVQFHGGYGFTWDCDAHLYVKRSLWSAATLGDAVHHRRHLADRLFG